MRYDEVLGVRISKGVYEFIEAYLGGQHSDRWRVLVLEECCRVLEMRAVGERYIDAIDAMNSDLISRLVANREKIKAGRDLLKKINEAPKVEEVQEEKDPPRPVIEAVSPKTILRYIDQNLDSSRLSDLMLALDELDKLQEGSDDYIEKETEFYTLLLDSLKNGNGEGRPFGIADLEKNPGLAQGAVRKKLKEALT